MIYESNRTMQLLGYQYASMAEPAAEELENIIDAYKKENAVNLQSICTDAFLLGRIYGIRAERERNRNNGTKKR